MGRTGIQSRAERGRFHRLHAGVYATHPPPFRRNQLWLAATLACGPGSLLSDLPVANLWMISDRPADVPHVTIPNGRGRSRHGITVHRRMIDPKDVRRKDGIPCTSVDRALIDLAPTHTQAELEVMLVAAESLGLLRRHRLAELLADHHGRPGIHKLRPLLALEPALTQSGLELLCFPIFAAAGLERPRSNHPIAVPGRSKPLRVDFAWPDLRLVVEADSQRYHGDWERAAADRERDQLLALAGWLCHRFVRRRLVEDPAGQAERMRTLVAVRRAELAR